MPTVPENAPTSTATSNGVDCEPDDAWKENLRKRIEEGLQSMVADAKENHATELSKAPDTPEARIRLEADYKDAMQTIKSLASEQYKLELDRERNQRRWTAGVPMTPGWSQYFRQEQQNIMNSIKQSNQTDNSVRTASESPTEERRSAIPKPSNEPPALAPTTPVLLPVPPSPSVRPTEEREKPFVSPQSVRRGSDVRSTLSGDRDDPGSFRRSHHASVHVRPGLPENWVATETVEEPEELTRSPPPRARLSSIDRPSQPSPVSPDVRWDSSLGRSSGSIHSAEPRSPPRAPPEVWKPAISPAEDALPAKSFSLGRRGSAASMRSTGSGASIRPSITETIPERADDDGPDESDDFEENDYERAQETNEHGRPWISTDKSRDKEIRPHLRRNSRQSPVDAAAGFRSEDVGSSSGLRSDDRHRPIDNPGKPPPYYDYREQPSPRDSYAQHRDQQVLPSPQDSRPISARSSYGGDERDYGPQYSTPHRSHGPKPPPYIPQRENRPISRQVSFTRPLHLNLEDENDEREIIDRGGGSGGGGRDRERHWDREYDRDRDRDGGRDIHPDPRRSTSGYPYSASRHSSYPNPPTPGGSTRPAPQDYDVHEDWEGVPGPRYNNSYRGPPLDNLDYQRRPDSARPGPGLSRQSSYVRPPRDDPERRFTTGDNDGYSRPFSAASGGGGIPIPQRHTPSFDETLGQYQQQQQQQPAWRDWAAEGNRHPNYDYQQQLARSPPPNTDSSFLPPRRYTTSTSSSSTAAAAAAAATHPLPQQSYPKNGPYDDRPPNFSGREMDSSSQPRGRGGSNRTAATDVYDSADEDTDSEEGEEEDEEEEDDDDDDDDDDDSSEEGIEAKRLRALEARKQKLEENRREADDELKRMELEIKQLAGEEARKRKEEEERRDEARRKEEEARKREEDARKKEEEIRRMGEEVKKKEEDAARKAEEAKKMEEMAKKKEADAKKKEKEARAKEQEAKRKEEAAKRKVEEARRKAEELSKKEEEAKQREAQLEQDTEKTKQMQLATQKIAEDLRKKEEENHRKDIEMKEREDTLRRREEELIRREADNLRREEEAKRKHDEALEKQEEARKREESKEKVRKDEEAKKEAARRKEEARKEREAARKEKARQEEIKRNEEKMKEEERVREEARTREEARRAKARQEEEEVRKEEARKKEEALQEAERKEIKRKAAEAKREEELRREARFEGFRREQEEKRLQNENQHFEDMFFDLDSNMADPKLMDEQLKVLQQAEFRKREEDIRRTREERKRNDSISNDGAWSNPSYLSGSPGTSPSMSRSPPQFNGPPNTERSAGQSPGGWGAGPASAWGPSIKPTGAASSPTANRSTASTSTGKPRTGSVSSGTYPTSSSPHTASFSEAERTRKQQEFAESQQEQFRRAQEKMEAERQLKSAGRPLSREELQRVFEHHERLWTRLNTLNELSWIDFPWPMAKQPSNPDDMSLPQISAYIQSPHYPDKDKSRTTKDRIKEHIKRWHPDRFETKLLPKVMEDEREKVKHGAGNVARYLSDLLRKENESNNNIFGD